ncbi:hypothetical protein EPU37_27590 [Escherichia coli]|nr:hypothetical protein EPU37_27590 [Escherichia coli]
MVSGINAPIKAGNSLPLRNIPLGSTVHGIELKPGKGAQLFVATRMAFRPSSSVSNTIRTVLRTSRC